MKKVGGEYNDTHHGTKVGKEVVCKWFADDFNKGASAEATAERQKTAKNARKAALTKVRRAKGPKLS